MSKEVRVEQRKELNRGSRRRRREGIEVAGEHLRPRAFNRNRDQLRLQPCPGRRSDARPVAPPAGEVQLAGGPVGPQVASRDFDQGRVGIDLAPGAKPLFWPDEGDALTATRSEGQQAVRAAGLSMPPQPDLKAS